jgi:hypothetical protein
MKQLSHRLGLVVIAAAAGCMGNPGPGDEAAPPPTTAGAVTAAGGDLPGNAVPASLAPLTDMVAPVHGATVPWAFLDSAAVHGRGACSGVSFDGVLATIRAGFPAVRDIVKFQSAGPRDAGPARPAGTPLPEPTAVDASVFGLADERGFAAIFTRYERCSGQNCKDATTWYFETDEACRPRWVGQYSSREGSRAIDPTRCFEITGAPLWGMPAALDPRDRCDADWSPRDVSGRHDLLALAPSRACGGPGVAFVPLALMVTQDADLAHASVVVEGSGVALLEGHAFALPVVRERLQGSFDRQVVEGACTRTGKIVFQLDFEGANIGLPNGIGLIDVTETVSGDCAVASSCAASLHLIRKI